MVIEELRKLLPYEEFLKRAIEDQDSEDGSIELEDVKEEEEEADNDEA